MANKVIQMKDGSDNIFPKTARATNVVTGTTGTTMYNNMYYVDINTGVSIADVLDIRIASQSNRPVSFIWISASAVRVYSTVANTTVTLEVVYER
ncbi:MAG: hypothetical protein IKG39_06005 [Lachnospiraceae bacterium]|nr:hypothetical protein [Lachnospiraceae bacterium]